MHGTDLRIAMRPLGVGSMGPPVLSTGAPVTVPGYPSAGSPQTMSPSQQAAQINYNTLRGHVPQPGTMGCKGCGPDGPSLRDIAPPSFLAKIPQWALWVGGIAGFGFTAWLIFALVRRSHRGY